jgi:hypothetical protein
MINKLHHRWIKSSLVSRVLRAGGGPPDGARADDSDLHGEVLSWFCFGFRIWLRSSRQSSGAPVADSAV